MKFHHRFWPWRRIIALEKEIAQLKAQHEVHHAKMTQQEGHMRKLVTIMAMKGGIMGLFLFVCSASGQGLVRNYYTTNNNPLIAWTNNAAGGFTNTTSPVGVLGTLNGPGGLLSRSQFFMVLTNCTSAGNTSNQVWWVSQTNQKIGRAHV